MPSEPPGDERPSCSVLQGPEGGPRAAAPPKENSAASSQPPGDSCVPSREHHRLIDVATFVNGHATTPGTYRLFSTHCVEFAQRVPEQARTIRPNTRNGVGTDAPTPLNASLKEYLDIGLPAPGCGVVLAGAGGVAGSESLACSPSGLTDYALADPTAAAALLCAPLNVVAGAPPGAPGSDGGSFVRGPRRARRPCDRVRCRRGACPHVHRDHSARRLPGEDLPKADSALVPLPGGDAVPVRADRSASGGRIDGHLRAGGGGGEHLRDQDVAELPALMA